MWFLKIYRLQYFFNQAFLVDNKSGNRTQDLAIFISSPVHPYPGRCTLEKLLSFTRTSFLSCTIVNPGEFIKIVVRINAFLKVFFFSFFFLEEQEEFMLYPTIPSPTEFCESPDVTRYSFFDPPHVLSVWSSVSERNLGRNLQKMAKFALTVSLAILLQVISVLAVYTEDKCIKGKYHKASPSPETAAFKACHAFKDSSCCTANFTVELMANETRNLYNHSWHRCGQLSEKCQQFWVTQVAIIFRRFTLARIAATGLSSQDRTDPPFARTKALDPKGIICERDTNRATKLF